MRSPGRRTGLHAGQTIRGEAVAGLGVGVLAEGKNLHRGDAEDQPQATSGITKTPIDDVEAPVELALLHRRQPLELRLVSHANGGSLDRHIQARAELVGSRREDAARVGLQVPGLLLM